MKKLLIADDEDNIRRLLAATLVGGDYDVIQARDGTQALALARRERPSFVVLDVSMPGLDGLEVCRQIKADPALRATTVVILTAQSQDETRRRATQAGADAFLTKPFSPLQLLEVIERRMTPR